MSKRLTGCTFIAIAAFLFATRYVSAAIFMSNIESHGRELFQSGLRAVGQGLHLWALTALIIGVVYLVLGERSDLKVQK
jgi:choline-glycine betaine transporter